MPRVLTVARATVDPADSEEYLATLGRVADRLATLGQHLWAFELHGERGTFLECIEGETTTSGGVADATLRTLERELARVASYATRHSERWDAVTLPTDRKE